MSASLPQENHWLLTGFILVSIAAHVLVFLHMSGIYESRTLTYIELSMKTTAKADARRLPTPKSRKIPKTTPLATPGASPAPARPPMPQPAPGPPPTALPDLPRLPRQMNVDQYRVSALAMPGPPAPAVASHGEMMQFATAREYFELMNLRINQMKTYPEAARSRHLQGRVKVAFVLASDGSISGLKLVKRSRHRSLNTAALEAVKKAVPFPVPPQNLIKTPKPLRISILFELT